MGARVCKQPRDTRHSLVINGLVVACCDRVLGLALVAPDVIDVSSSVESRGHRDVHATLLDTRIPRPKNIIRSIKKISRPRGHVRVNGLFYYEITFDLLVGGHCLRNTFRTRSGGRRFLTFRGFYEFYAWRRSFALALSFFLAENNYNGLYIYINGLDFSFFPPLTLVWNRNSVVGFRFGLFYYSLAFRFEIFVCFFSVKYFNKLSFL